MTDLLKDAAGKVPPWLAAALGLLSLMFTTIHGAGYQSAKVEGLERDVVRLEREVRILHARTRRLQRWPSRAGNGSTRTDQQ